MASLIEINGSYGEGGGQVLRTAVSLAAIVGRPCRIFNIRSGRRNPGLAAQHLTGVRAAAQLCDGELEGAKLRSQEVRFQPDEIRGGSYQVSVGTAGAVTLVLQTLVPIALQTDGRMTLEIKGGTDVTWSPLIDYFTHVHCHFLREWGAEIEVETLRRGFYPRGGGRVRVSIQPWADSPGPIHLKERGRVEAVEIWDVVSEDLRRARVAERQMEGFEEAWQERYPLGEVHQLYVDSASPGTSFHAYAHCEKTRLGVCSIGRRGKRAEVVGREAAELLLEELASGAAVDRWMADQLIPYLGLYGGVIQTSRITDHVRTNILVTEQFLPCRFSIEGTAIRCQR
ncbi:MAG: RNA 3'-terminal phosphate cyclase [Chloroflexota bacterium]|nr:RNA 3'-terminal phosphate cyclase [Chloroflexota bacterium]